MDCYFFLLRIPTHFAIPMLHISYIIKLEPGQLKECECIKEYTFKGWALNSRKITFLKMLCNNFLTFKIDSKIFTPYLQTIPLN